MHSILSQTGWLGRWNLLEGRRDVWNRFGAVGGLTTSAQMYTIGIGSNCALSAHDPSSFTSAGATVRSIFDNSVVWSAARWLFRSNQDRFADESTEGNCTP